MIGTRNALLIAGPTASGKSALALHLARRLNAVVVNADSMQVYADLRVLTARPSPDDEAAAPHRLYGFIDAAVNYSVGRWMEDARAVLSECRKQERLAIVVGGSGLYFKALIAGLPEMPPVPEEVRQAVRREAEGFAAPDLHARLAAVDAATAAKLRPSDRQRILRALEFQAATGRSLSEVQQGAADPPVEPGTWLGFFLAPDRAVLRARIEERFDAMIAQGALDEVRALAARGLNPALPAMRAHGAPGLLAYLAGQATLEDAITRGKADTRRYVKRQFTFARHQLPQFSAVSPETAESLILRALGAP